MKRERDRVCNNSQKQYNIRILFLVMISSFVISLCNITTTVRTREQFIHKLFQSSHTLSLRSSFYTFHFEVYRKPCNSWFIFTRTYNPSSNISSALTSTYFRDIILRSAVNSYTSKRNIYFCKWQRCILAHSMISSLIFLMSRIFVCIILAINAFIAHFQPAKKLIKMFET